MRITDLLRWIVFFPLAVVAGFTAGGLVLQVGNYLVGYWWIPSAIVICFGATFIPVAWMMTGLNVAPKKTVLVKWILLTPLLIISLLNVIGLVLLHSTSTSPLETMAGESISHSLSPYWQMVLFQYFFIGVTGVLATKSPSEITD